MLKNNGDTIFLNAIILSFEALGISLGIIGLAIVPIYYNNSIFRISHSSYVLV
jgi:hypothetical protein